MVEEPNNQAVTEKRYECYGLTHAGERDMLLDFLDEYRCAELVRLIKDRDRPVQQMCRQLEACVESPRSASPMSCG